MKYLVWLSRGIVGLLFVLSGLVKLNDPVGFSYKLEEYFSQGVLDIPFLLPWALAIALVVVIIEVLLGVLLLLGFAPKVTVWSLLGLTVFFTFLTFYSAYFNTVTDCGCFGDAIPLTPWQSFTKDVLLLGFISVLCIGQKHLRPLWHSRVNWAVSGLALLGCIGLGYNVLHHLPVVDFRPYALGVNVVEDMQLPEGAPKPVYAYAWRFTVAERDTTVVTYGDYPAVQGTFVGVETTQVQKGYEPPIHDFTMERQGADKTAELLAHDRLVLVVAYDLAQSCAAYFGEIAELTIQAQAKGYTVVGLTASDEAAQAAVKTAYGLNFDFYFTDEITLKTMVRSNPGVLVVTQGTISQKVHYNDLEALRFE